LKKGGGKGGDGGLRGKMVKASALQAWENKKKDVKRLRRRRDKDGWANRSPDGSMTPERITKIPPKTAQI